MEKYPNPLMTLEECIYWDKRCKEQIKIWERDHYVPVAVKCGEDATMVAFQHVYSKNEFTGRKD